MTQSQALSILKTGANVFLTGEPGSGKTHIVNKYAAYLRAHGVEPAITASTGIAATHIGGMTIHSWSGIGIKTKLNKYDLDKIASNKRIVKRVLCSKIVIIDEVSMLPPETLAMIDAVCREIRQSSRPFGGIQIVLVGDFFQLPPIVKPVLSNVEGTEAENGAQTAFIEESPVPRGDSELSARFAYDSSAWKRANLTVCYLTEQYRQDDSDFLALLSAIRNNTFGSDHLSRVETRKIDSHAAPDGVPKLFSHNIDVDRVNNEVLFKLSGKSQVFNMSSQGPDVLISALKKGCLSPETLYLKVGAAVMFTKNSQKESFVNGTLGTVEEFDKHSGYPTVKTRSGKRIKVEPMDWAMEENGKIRARITQLPLRLAWAITVHKSQGMSLDEAAMDLSNVFEFGQGYVALSRVRRFSGLYLFGWNERAFQVYPDVLVKDTEFRAQSEQSVRAFDNAGQDEMAAMHKRFIHACDGKQEEIILSQNMIHEPGNTRHERRWERTIELIRSGKTISAVAEIRGRTEGTILGHLESLRALGKLSAQDIAHLARGSEQAIAEIHAVFRELGTDKLSPVFEKLGGVYSYDKLRVARLMLNEQFAQKIPAQLDFEKTREKHPNAYLSWDKSQDDKLRDLFVRNLSISNLAKIFSRTRGAISSRLIKLGLITKI